MKEGMTLEAMTTEVRRQAIVRQDHVFSSGELRLLTQAMPLIAPTRMTPGLAPSLTAQQNHEYQHKACSEE